MCFCFSENTHFDLVKLKYQSQTLIKKHIFKLS